MDRRTIEIHTLEDSYPRLMMVKHISHIKAIDNNSLYIYLTMGPSVLISFSSKEEMIRCYEFVKLNIIDNHDTNEFAEIVVRKRNRLNVI